MAALHNSRLTSCWSFCGFRLVKCVNVTFWMFFRSDPIPSMYGIFTYSLVDFYGFHVGKYTYPSHRWVLGHINLWPPGWSICPDFGVSWVVGKPHLGLMAMAFFKRRIRSRRIRWRAVFCWYRFFWGEINLWSIRRWPWRYDRYDIFSFLAVDAFWQIVDAC